jgi:predicted phosphodiesterase
MLQNIEEASTVNRIDPKEFSTQIDPSINLTKYERILVSSDWYDRYAEAKQLLETFKPTEKDVIILLGNYSAKKIHPAEMTQLITDLSNNPQVILLRGSQDKFCPNCKDYLFMEYNQQHYLLTHAPQSNLPTRLTNGNWLNKSMYTDPAQLSTIYTEWENTQKDTIHIHGHNNYWSYDIQPRTNIFNLTSDIEFGGAIRALIITKDSTTALEIPAILKDTQEKPIETTDTHYYNFSTTREGLTNIRLSETYPYNHVLTTYATYLLVDKDKIVLRSFDKLCHLKHLPRSIKKILSFPLSIELKHNGFTGLLGVHNEDFIFKVTSTNEEPYSELFKELLPVFKDSHSELLNTLKGHTLVFEVMHDEANRNPAEAIDSNFLYLLASINNETGVINTKSNTKFVNYINKYGTVAVIPQRVLTTKLHNLEELIEFITLVENSEEGIEGYVIRDQKGFGFKVTTYYYKYKTIDKLTGLNFKNAHNDIT